jgi:hypothetical protein
VNRRHVGHRAPSRHVGQHHRHPLAAALGQLLRPVGQDVGRLRHKVHATERDVPAVGAVGRHLAELVAIPREISQGDDFVLLIMVAENQQLGAELVAHRLNPPLKLGVVQRLVRLQLELRRGGRSGAHVFSTRIIDAQFAAWQANFAASTKKERAA